MPVFWEQFELLARNGDEDVGGWMQLLVFIVIAVIYALGSLVKSKAGKEEGGNQNRQEHRPRYKPIDESKAANRYSQQQRVVSSYTIGRESKPTPPIQRREQPVQVAADRPAVAPVRAQRGIDLKAEMAEALRKKRILAAQKKAKLGETKKIDVSMPAVLSAKVAKKKLMKRPAVAEAAEVTIGQALVRLADVNDLRAAILYHEIIGKPVGLRDPSF